MSPAARIIKKLGGIQAVADGLRVTSITVRKWDYPVAKGGTGGFIPRKRWPALIAFAESRGVKLTRADLIDLPVSDAVEQAAAQ